MRPRGRQGAEGARLTTEGRAFLACYRRFRRSLEEQAARRFTRAFE